MANEVDHPPPDFSLLMVILVASSIARHDLPIAQKSYSRIILVSTRCIIELFLDDPDASTHLFLFRSLWTPKPFLPLNQGCLDEFLSTTDDLSIVNN